MKKLLGVALFALAVVALSSVEGIGASDCSGPGGPAPAPVVSAPISGGSWSGSPAVAGDPCAAGVTYVDQVMTGYRAETRTRTGNRSVSSVVTREVDEPYTWTEQVPVTVAEKRTRTVCRTVTKQVPYTFTVNVPYTVAQKQTRTVCRTVEKQVPYTWTEQVPVTTVQKQK